MAPVMTSVVTSSPQPLASYDLRASHAHGRCNSPAWPQLSQVGCALNPFEKYHIYLYIYIGIYRYIYIGVYIYIAIESFSPGMG